MGYLVDDEPVNNENKSVEEVIIPKKKLNISNVFGTKQEMVNQKPSIDDSKCKSVEIGATKVPNNINPVLEVKPQEVYTPDAQLPIPVQTVVQAPIVQAPIVQNKVERVIRRNTGVFIQVGAYAKYLPTKALKRLANNGNHIILRHRGNITKILIGPYHSRREALKAMSKIKRIVPQAFIYKGK
jgi:cell division protein FtsN